MDDNNKEINYFDYIIENENENGHKLYLEKLAEELANSIPYSEYITNSLANIGEDLSKKKNESYGTEIIDKISDCVILSDYMLSDNYWISDDDTLIDDDGYVYEILVYEIMNGLLFLKLDGHLKLNIGDILYVK